MILAFFVYTAVLLLVAIFSIAMIAPLFKGCLEAILEEEEK